MIIQLISFFRGEVLFFSTCHELAFLPASVGRCSLSPSGIKEWNPVILCCQNTLAPWKANEAHFQQAWKQDWWEEGFEVGGLRGIKSSCWRIRYQNFHLTFLDVKFLIWNENFFCLEFGLLRCATTGRYFEFDSYSKLAGVLLLFYTEVFGGWFLRE